MEAKIVAHDGPLIGSSRDPVTGIRITEFRNRRAKRQCYVRVETVKDEMAVALYFFRHEGRPVARFSTGSRASRNAPDMNCEKGLDQESEREASGRCLRIVAVDWV